MDSPTLSEYIKTIGDEKAAQIFGVELRTAKSWRLGERTPRTSKISVILKKTPVTYDGIVKSRKKRSA